MSDLSELRPVEPSLAPSAVASALVGHLSANRLTSHGNLPLAVVGCDFRVASSQWRNRLLLAGSDRDELTAALRVSCGASGLVVVETCNRVEWLVSAPAPQWAGEVLRAQMAERFRHVSGVANDDPLVQGTQLSRAQVQVLQLPMPYVYTGRSAVRHLLRVAVGMESFVVGEREIAGQLNRALGAARIAGQGSGFHNALQTALGRTVKKVQRLTSWRQHSRGVPGLALDVVQQHLRGLAAPDFRATVVVVGMGEIGRKVAGVLASTAKCKIIKVNRSQPADKAHDFRGFHDLPALVHQAHALVVATGSRQPVVDLRQLLADRPSHLPPLLVVDLGAPPQVAGTILNGAAMPGTAYFDLDALLALPTVAPDEAEAAHVLEIVEEGLHEFVLECKKRDLAGLLRAVHDTYDRVAYQDLPKVLLTEQGLDLELRGRVESAMRDLLRAMTREVVQHVETAADSQVKPPRSR